MRNVLFFFPTKSDNMKGTVSAQGRKKYSANVVEKTKACDRDHDEMVMAMPSNQNLYDKFEVCRLALN